MTDEVIWMRRRGPGNKFHLLPSPDLWNNQVQKSICGVRIALTLDTECLSVQALSLPHEEDAIRADVCTACWRKSHVPIL